MATCHEITRFTVVGVGAAGSAMALAGSKMFPDAFPRYIDHDKVEEHNVRGQLYTRMHIGHDKAEVLAKLLGGRPVVNKVEESQVVGEWVHLSTDNFSSRIEAVNKAINSDECRYITDIRMQNKHYQCYCFTRDNFPECLKILNMDKEVTGTVERNTGEPVPCTTNSGFYVGMIASGLCLEMLLRAIDSPGADYQVAIGNIDQLIA